MLTLFVITGTYNVNKALNWNSNSVWYNIHSILFRFMSGATKDSGNTILKGDTKYMKTAVSIYVIFRNRKRCCGQAFL